ncbi:MAG: hypothetical protein AB7P78_13180 [Candidatus Binatia bacterium]
MTTHMANRLAGRAALWLVACALVVGNLLLHKPISDVCDAAAATLGRRNYERISFVALGAVSIAGGALLLRRARRGRIAPRSLVALTALASTTAIGLRWFLVSNIEIIHLPQFGLLAALMAAAGLSPASAWAAATAAGVLDESYQRLVIYPLIPNPRFDWNDVVLNAIGAAWAVLLLACAAPAASKARPPHWRVPLMALAIGALAVALWTAPPRVRAMDGFPYWLPSIDRAPTGRPYHVVPASEGIAALLALWVIVAIGAGAKPRDRAGERLISGSKR